jgi:hypothetical protein
MSALDEVGRQGVPGYKHLRAALAEGDEPGRRRTLVAPPIVIPHDAKNAVGQVVENDDASNNRSVAAAQPDLFSSGFHSIHRRRQHRA